MTTRLRTRRDQRALSGDAAGTGAGAPTRLRRAGGALYRAGLPVFGVVVTLGAWWWATWFFEIRPYYLPSPPDVIDSLGATPEDLAAQSWATVYQTLFGFTLGGLGGLAIAASLTFSPTLQRATLPLVIGLNAIPKVALIPLLLAWMGLGYGPNVVLAALICFFPVMIAAMAGLSSTPAELGDLARSLSASGWQSFFKVRVPWALPQVFVGLKLGITLALIGAVVAQLARPSGEGLGTVILHSRQTANTPRAFAAILLLMVISITLFYTVVLVERLLLPWARETTAGRT